MKKTLLYPIILFLFCITSCSNLPKTEEINPYYIIDGDTIAYLMERNDTLSNAKIRIAPTAEDIDSIYNHLYESFKLQDFTTCIYVEDDNYKKTHCKLILDGEANIFAHLKYSFADHGIITTPLPISNDTTLQELTNKFNLSRSKFFVESDYKKMSTSDKDPRYSLDYYAACTSNGTSYFNKPFACDTIRILNYFIEVFDYMLNAVKYENRDIYIHNEEQVLEYALAIRYMGDFAKKCTKKTSTKKEAKKLIDSLNENQKYFFMWLRGAYEDMLLYRLNDYKVTSSNIDEFQDDKELYLSSPYFVSEDICIKILNKRDNIIRFLGVKSVRFNWSMRAYLDHVYPILPKKAIHDDTYIGWASSMNMTRTIDKVLEDISDIYPNTRYFN